MLQGCRNNGLFGFRRDFDQRKIPDRDRFRAVAADHAVGDFRDFGEREGDRDLLPFVVAFHLFGLEGLPFFVFLKGNLQMIFFFGFEFGAENIFAELDRLGIASGYASYKYTDKAVWDRYFC